MAGRDGRVRGEHAATPHRFEVGRCGAIEAPGTRRLFEQGQGEQSRVPLVHVIGVDLVEAERPQRRDSANAEQHFLGQAVTFVAAVELSCEGSVAGVVFRQVGVQQIYGHGVAADTADGVAPGPQRNRAILDADRDPVVQRLEIMRRLPGVRLFALVAVFVQALAEVALAVQQGDRHHGHAEVGGGAQGVACEHAEASAVGRHGRLEAGLHGEVGDARRRGDPFGHKAR